MTTNSSLVKLIDASVYKCLKEKEKEKQMLDEIDSELIIPAEKDDYLEGIKK